MKENRLVKFENFDEYFEYFKMPKSENKDILFENYEKNDGYYIDSINPFEHKFYGILLSLEGQGDFKLGFLDSKLKCPAIYFITPNQKISWNIDNKSRLRKKMIAVTENFVNESPILNNMLFDFPFLHNDKPMAYLLKEDQVQLFDEMFSNIEKLYKSNYNSKYELITLNIKIILLIIKDTFEMVDSENTNLKNQLLNNNDKIIGDFFSLLNSEILDISKPKINYNVKYFANRLNVHPNYLSKVLKDKTNKTAKQHLDYSYLEISKKLLTKSSMTIKEISFFLGFNEPAHFTSFFKRLVGFTPQSFRRKL